MLGSGCWDCFSSEGGVVNHLVWGEQEMKRWKNEVLLSGVRSWYKCSTLLPFEISRGWNEVSQMNNGIVMHYSWIC
jgi:hypothetical protein